jgi:acyl-homoserine lactone acylase PvdQ
MRRRILVVAMAVAVLAAPAAAQAAKKSYRAEIRRTTGGWAHVNSQSENPRSPHYADQTRLFSQKKWIPMRFTERSIRRDDDYKRTVVSGRR